jgi:drug/metabolite transporter (DMT)-like permease
VSSHGRLLGTGFALAAGLLWGLVFVVPLLLPSYSPVLLSVGRYLSFGLIALPLAWLDRVRLRELTRADWIEALKLAAIGNLLYYLLLAAAIQRAGAPLPTMLIGTLPVVIAISANLRRDPAVRRRDGRLPWLQLVPALVLIGAGIALVNHAELALLRASGALDISRHALGALLAIGAVACWTWYPIRNADWLRAHATRSPRTWATAQGVATLPLAAIGLALHLAWTAGLPSPGVDPVEGVLGADPQRFVLLMLTLGLLASWLGTLCWNEASQRLPAALAGPLIVFETLAALDYAFALRGEWPAPATLAGIALLIAGVVWALRVRPEQPAEAAAGAPH